MPSLYRYRALSALVSIVCLAGCEAAKSANPTAPSVAGPIPGVNITAPKPLEPGAGSTLVYDGKPPTLLIENAGSSGTRTIWLQLEVASDAALKQIVHQADQITPGPDGRTSYRMPSPLGAGFTYYWRTRAVDGANIGPYSTVSSFTVVTPVVIAAPVPIAPTGTLNTNKPEFKVTNGAISGTSGVAYRFEVSKSPDFFQLTAIVTVPVNGSGTTTMSLGELPYKTTYYWRVKGTDGTNESSYSNPLVFTTMDVPPPPTAPAPPAQSVDASQWTTEPTAVGPSHARVPRRAGIPRTNEAISSPSAQHRITVPPISDSRSASSSELIASRIESRSRSSNVVTSSTPATPMPIAMTSTRMMILRSDCLRLGGA